MVEMKTTRTITTKVTLDRKSVEEILLKALDLPLDAEVRFRDCYEEGSSLAEVVITHTKEEEPQELTSLIPRGSVNDLQEK